MRDKYYNRQTRTLLPASADQYVGQDELSRFIVDAVAKMDLDGLRDTYGRRGSSYYPPEMMLALVLYAYVKGVTSSREIEEKLKDSLSFMYVAGGLKPDHSTIAAFKTRALPFFDDYLKQLLVMASEAGLLDCSEVCLDGTKIKANASRHRAFSYKRGCDIEEKLLDEIETLERMKPVAGTGIGLGIDIQAETEIRARKLVTVRKGLAQIEADRAAAYAAELEAFNERVEARGRQEEETGRKPRGKEPVPPSDRPAPSAQANLTDSDSRMMRNSSKGWDQSYNCQLGVDRKSMLVVCGHVSQKANDVQEMDRSVRSLAEIPEAAGKTLMLAADAGYFSEHNVKCCEAGGIDPFIAAGRSRHHERLEAILAGPGPEAGPEASCREKMRRKLQDPAGKLFYAFRKQVVEPVIGIIKRCMDFREFTVRGLKKVSQEWSLLICAYNLKRMHKLVLSRK